MPRTIDLIVIHCSASPNGDSLYRGNPGESNYRTPVETIDAWHKQRGFLREYSWRVKFNPALDAIGYHYIIYTSGTVATGRSPSEVGAHAQGHNAHSIGVCLVGTDKFTAYQWHALKRVVDMLRREFPDARVVGHRDLPKVAKACPCFDVATWLASDCAVPDGRLLPVAQ